MTASRPIAPEDHPQLLALNNEHAAELSLLQKNAFARLASQAFLARSIKTEAFIFAFDQDADYDSPNFLWFRQRYPRFVYVDRVVVAEAARGRGHARRLYDELFAAARESGQDRVVCEVNIRPSNAASDAFHERLGFLEVGRAEIHDGAKLVRYLERQL
ncbi:GNAT family N-acetyltransferase [Aureimonas leprariae]|uniref:GNAT family N-acetyltransferase n=1 Tax=Plantimonas leprariae TaxID=2615207 RepID=A0A7V7PJY9_9HYPH|nr:GNAT family N-acetyltransferase [Aureimonas leprariae]KAB0675741.1 GNAT family N-acetyltransferase [Aureimonas leprariae]